MKRVALLIVVVLVAVNVIHRSRQRVSIPPRPLGPPAGFTPPRSVWHGRVFRAQHRRPGGQPAPAPVVEASADAADRIPPPEPPRPPAALPAPEAPEAPAALVAELPETLGPEAAPAWFAEEAPPKPATAPVSGPVTIKGRVSLDPPRADADARRKLREVVTDWLVPDVPRTWVVPQREVESSIVDRYIEPVATQFGVMHKAGFRVNLTPQFRSRIVEDYHRDIGTKRLFVLGGGLGFVLICLASLAGYIRADEATKGYYTNRLRLVAAAAVGAAGMAIARLLI